MSTYSSKRVGREDSKSQTGPQGRRNQSTPGSLYKVMGGGGEGPAKYMDSVRIRKISHSYNHQNQNNQSSKETTVAL